MQKLVYHEKIYTYHIDFVGHVNNIVYIKWMENGRHLLLEAMGFPISDLSDVEGIAPVLTETKIEYKHPLYLHNSVTVEIWISKLNNASAIMEFCFYNEKNQCCATGRQKGLFINSKTKRPARLSESYRAAFEKYLLNE